MQHTFKRRKISAQREGLKKIYPFLEQKAPLHYAAAYTSEKEFKCPSNPKKKKKSIDIKLTKDIHIGWLVENYQIDSTLHVSDTKT